MLAIGLAMIITALVLNQLGHLVPVTHVSPSRYFKATPGVVSIAELTQIPTKEYSSDSFPGDHGMLLMIFAAFMLHFFDRKGFLQGVLVHRCGGWFTVHCSGGLGAVAARRRL